MNRFRTSLVAIFTIASCAFIAPSAHAASVGQLCSSAKEGQKDGSLVCKKDGSRFRWAGSGSAAPATTKAAKTTKATSSSGSSSSGTKKASTGGGEAVNGRFCAKADAGRKATDNKGQTLTCSADGNRYRWKK